MPRGVLSCQGMCCHACYMTGGVIFRADDILAPRSGDRTEGPRQDCETCRKTVAIVSGSIISSRVMCSDNVMVWIG